jgi:hypothetical protein
MDFEHIKIGGTQIRTGGKGFADPCLTTWPCHLDLEGASIAFAFLKVNDFAFFVKN